MIGRFVLGVRERNVRVAYLRPWLHQEGDLSIEATNVKMVKDLADELRAHGFRLGRATPIPPLSRKQRHSRRYCRLAVPSIFVLLLGWFGWYRPSYAIAAYALTIAALCRGCRLALRHARAFDHRAHRSAALRGRRILRCSRRHLTRSRRRASAIKSFAASDGRCSRPLVALAGALVVVGIMSSPLAMEEIERFRGVQAVLALPPLIALCDVPLHGRFNTVTDARRVFGSPIAFYQLLSVSSSSARVPCL